jgi:hypothetical protein
VTYLPPEKPMLDPGWDDGADVAIGLLAHEILTTGATPLNPDANRITTYDPVPLISRDDPEQAERRKQKRELSERLERRRLAQMVPPAWQPQAYVKVGERWLKPEHLVMELLSRPRPAPEPPPVTRPQTPIEPVEPLPPLPLGFLWLLDDDKRISQGSIEAFWAERRRRDFRRDNFWPGDPTPWAAR